MAQSMFAKAFVNKAKKTFNEARKHKHREGNSFGPVPVPDGSYPAVITFETSVPAKGKMEGIPIVKVKAAINEGKYAGLEPSKSFFCEGKPIPTDPDERPTAEQELLGLLQWILPDMDISEVEQVPDAIELVNERGPVCLIGIRNTVNEATKKEYQNLYLNKLLKASSFETADDQGSDSPEADAAGEPEEAGSDGGDDYVPAKDDIVTVEGLDGEWTVAAVSQARKTVNLSNEEGTRKNGVAWQDCLLV